VEVVGKRRRFRMRDVAKIFAVMAAMAMATGPALAGAGCLSGAEARGACGAKAQAGCGAAQAYTCGFSDVLTGGGCCANGAHADLFRATQVDVVETPDGYIAVVSADSEGRVEVLQAMLHQGWEAVQTARDTEKLCPLCKDLRRLVGEGAKVEIQDTSVGALVIVRARSQEVVKELHDYAERLAKARAPGDQAKS
jgi:hypothetical protein